MIELLLMQIGLGTASFIIGIACYYVFKWNNKCIYSI